MDLLRPRRLLTTGLAAALLTAPGCGTSTGGSTAEPGPTVLAASSLTDVFTELAEHYENDHPGETVTLSFAASSSLREQVLAGAPADVVALADDEMGEELYSAGAFGDRPRVFARNELVIAVPEDNPEDVHTLSDLERDGLLVGACAAEVPCGALARRVIDTAGQDVGFTSHEPNARSLLTRIEERELDAGLVYHTDARARPAVDRIRPPDLPSGPDLTAVYTIAPAGGDRDGTGSNSGGSAGSADPGHRGEPRGTEGDDDPASAFVDLVLSPSGRQILADAGFLPPEPL